MSITHTGATETIIPTFCHGCGSYHPECGLLCHVREGKFVRVEANPAAANNGVPGSKMLCAKGLTGPQFVYAADRLKYPLIRKNGSLQPATWDEALDFAAQGLRKIKDEHGPDAIAGLSSARCTTEENYLFQKFMRAAVGTNNVDHCARL